MNDGKDPNADQVTPKRSNRHVEDAEQAALLEWARYAFPSFGLGGRCLFAIPNGAHLAGDERTRARQMGRLKRLGLVAGAADLFLARASGRYHGLFIEMKKPESSFRSEAEIGRAVSEDQRRFADEVRGEGYAWIACYGAGDAIAAIKAYLRRGELE